MSKLNLTDLANFRNSATVIAVINNNSAATETAVENTLSRDGTSPNQMLSQLDMNSNRIINLPAPVSPTEPLRRMDLPETEFVQYFAGAGLALTGSTFSVAPLGVTNAMLAGSIVASKLATNNSDVGTFGSSTQTSQFTVNAQGLITQASTVTITPALGSIVGLGAGVATFLATPSSANLAAAVSNETGSGALVFAISPTLTTPVLGVATGTSLNLSSTLTVGSTVSIPSSYITMGTRTGNDGEASHIRLYDSGAASTSYGFGVSVAGILSANTQVAHEWAVNASPIMTGTSSVINIPLTTATTSTTTGALKVAGGVGVAGNVAAASYYIGTVATLQAGGGFTILNNLTGGIGIAVGNPLSLYLSDTHRFDNNAANVAFVDISSTGILVYQGAVTLPSNPTQPLHAATKQYVDSLASGLQPKASVVAATTVAGTLATSFANGSVIDGVTLATGNRILIKNQAAPADNGIYTVNGAGAPTRATDLNTWAASQGAVVFVTGGTANISTSWVAGNTAGGTIGVTAMVWTQFAASSTYLPGSGLTLTGNTFSITPAGVTSSMLASALTLAGATTISGTLTLAADPTLALQAATKQYVDAAAAPLASLAEAQAGTSTTKYMSPQRVRDYLETGSSFLQTGSGAVARAMRDKVRELAVSVKDFGATGNGSTDDTTTIQAALNSGASAVFVPTGTYKVGSVTVPAGVRLFGTQSIHTGNPSDITTGSWFYCGTDVTNPVVIVKSGASVEGLGFWYPSQVSNATPTVYPPSIQFDHDVYNAMVRNCFFANSYIAINNSASSVNGSFTITDCWGYALSRGISLSNGTDITHITRVQFSKTLYPGASPGATLIAWVQANGLAFDIGRQDNGRASDCFAFGYNIGFRNLNTTGGWQWINCSADGCKFPWSIEGTSTAISLVGCSLTAASFADATDPLCDALTVNCTGKVLVSSCRFGYSARYAVSGVAASSLLITGCEFNSIGALAPGLFTASGVRLDSTIANVSITNNMIDGNNNNNVPAVIINNGALGTQINNNLIKNTGTAPTVLLDTAADKFTIVGNIFNHTGGIVGSTSGLNTIIANNLSY